MSTEKTTAGATAATTAKTVGNSLPVGNYLEAILLRKAITKYAEELSTAPAGDSLLDPEEVTAALTSLKTKVNQIPYLNKGATATTPAPRKPREAKVGAKAAEA